MDNKQKKRGVPIIEALEPRMLFSADMFAGAADSPATDDSLATLLDDTAAVLEQQPAQLEKDQTQSEPSELSPQDYEVTSLVTETSLRTELVFVDTDTPDYQQLVDGMLAESDDDRRLEVILLDKNLDGIEQITATLQDYQAVDAIHIISHGSDGAVHLASGQISNENLFSYQSQLQSWAEYLDSDADILFYGCDLAASESGKGLINTISELTQADVAASDDLTGHQSLGGDWDLEYQAGDIEAAVAISESQQSQWQHILPVLNGANDLQSIDEDPVSNNGTLVSDFIAGQIAHDNGGGIDGIAVTAVDDSNGTWEYTTDGGTNWIAFGAVDSSAARLLAADANTSVRFVPEADWNGTVTDGITFQAWDQTSGTAGGTMDLSTTYVLDSFESGYSGNNGSVNWAGSWQESGEFTSSSGGNILISSAGSVVTGSYLEINLDSLGTGISREVDLSGATSATLSFTYEENTTNFGGQVTLQVFDGSSWHDLRVYAINEDRYQGTLGIVESFDISAYAAANTQIRFLVTDAASGDRMYIDDVRIDFTTSGTGGSSAFSAESASSSVTVTPVNDAPIDLTTTSNTQGGISLNEDGGNDTYLVADSGLPSPLSQFTVEVQFEGKNTSPDHETAFISYNTASGDVLSIQTVSSTDTNNPNALELDIGTGIPVYSDAIDYNAALMDGQSHTLSVSWDNTAGDWSVYIDGVLVDSGTGLSVGETIPTGGTLMFGQEQDGAGGSGSLDPLQHFNGTLYDVRLFDDVRTATEVATHYSETLPSNEPGLVANWIFDNLSDSGGVIDSVGGNNLTVGHASGAGFTPSNPELILSVLDTDVSGTVVGTLSTIDPDSGDSFTYTLLDNAGGRFDIDPVSGEITVLDASLIDYQTATSHAITVQVTDSGGLTYSEIFTIEVVEATNDAPIGTAMEDTALSYTENDGAVAITSTLAITDADDTNIQSAVVQITAGYLSSEDVLSFTDQNGITGSYDAGTGTLTLTGSATLEQYETALRSITYSNSSENPDTTTRTVAFTVNDGNADSLTQTRDITITSVNDAPTVGTNAGATIAEGGLVTITTAMLNEADPDDAGTELTYTVTSGPTSGQLELTTNPGVAITSFTQDDIDNNRLIFVHDGSQVTTDAFDFSLADGGEDGAAVATGTFNFNVTNVNDAPTAANNTITTNEDTTYTFTATDFNFSDIDGDALASVQITSLESAGALQLNGADVTLNQVITKVDIDAGNLTFTPVADANGTGYDSFGFSVNDGTVDSPSSYTMTVDVTAQNDAPTTSPVTLAPIAEDSGARTITQAELLGNANDLEGDSLTATGLVISSGNGSLTDNGDGTWDYTPATNDDTSVSFSYSITDGIATAAGSATLDITPVDDAVTIGGDTSGTGNEDTVISGTLTASDSADGLTDGTYFTVSTDATNGTALIDPETGLWSYTPSADFNGSDSFTVTVTDDDGYTDTQVINVTVTPVVDIVDDNLITNEETAVSANVLTGTNGASADSFEGAPTLTGVTNGSNGSVSFLPDGTITYTPDANFNGNDSFTYTITSGGVTETGTVNVTVNAVTDLTAQDDSVSVDEDTSLSGTVAGNDSTTSGGALSYALATDVSNGSLTLNNDGSFTYTPAANYHGGDSFTYTVTDSVSGESATQTVAITINPINDAAVFSGDTSGSGDEDTVISGSLSVADTADGMTSPNYTVSTDGVNGTASIDAAGNWTYTPTANWSGSDSFTVSVTDDEGNVESQVISVTVNPVGDLTAQDDSFGVDEDTSLSGTVAGNDSTTSGGALSYALATDVNNGSLTLNPDGSFTYTPAVNYNGGDSFTYTVTDSVSGESATRTVNLTINPVDDAASMGGDTSGTGNEDTAISGTLTASDSADGLTDGTYFTVSTAPANGTASIDPETGLWSYTPSSNWSGSDSFTVSVTDDEGNVQSQVITLIVNPATDLMAQDDSFSVGEDSTLSDTVAGNDSTTSGGALSYALVADVSNGSLSFNNDGSFTYTPTATYIGSDSFTYTVTDSVSGESSTQTVSINVIQINDTVISEPVAPSDPEPEAEPEPEPESEPESEPEPEPEPKSDPEPETGQKEETAPAVEEQLAPIDDELLVQALATESAAPEVYQYETQISKPVPPKSIDLLNLDLAPFESDQSEIGDLASIIQNTSFSDGLNEMKRHLDDAAEATVNQDKIKAEILLGATAGLSVGVISWVLRTGSLIAGFMSVAPLWRQIDPIPVLGQDDEGENPEKDAPDAESEVEQIFSNEDVGR